MSSIQLSDNHEARSPEVFLDTSIHCCWFKGSGFTNRIHQVLSLFRWRGTSTYTKLEYGQVVLAQAEYYLRKLQQFGSLDRLLYHIGNVLNQSQHSQKVTWSFNLLVQHRAGDDTESTERARLYLQTLMGMGTKFVEKKVDGPLEDGTACYWARQSVVQRADGTLTWKTPDCKQSKKKRCEIDTFFTKNREVFQKIKAAIDNLPVNRKTAQLAAFSQIIGEAIDDPTVLLNYRDGCRRLADAIIAVDGQNYKAMFSQNVKESEVLCRVLSQTFYYLPPNEEKGVLVYDPSSGDDSQG